MLFPRRTGWALHLLAALAAGPVGTWLCAACVAGHGGCPGIPVAAAHADDCCGKGRGGVPARPPAGERCVLKDGPRVVLPPPVDPGLAVLPPVLPAVTRVAAPALNRIAPPPPPRDGPLPDLSPERCHAPRGPPVHGV